MSEANEVQDQEASGTTEVKEEKKERKPRRTFREKFAESTPKKERIQLAQEVAEFRIDPDADRAMSWKKIREEVMLSSDEFHKIIRLSDYYKDAILGRLETLTDEGWVYTGSLNTLTGIEVPDELVAKMEANKSKAKVKFNSDEGSGGDEGGNSGE